MIPDQIKIADDLLRYVKEKRGYSSLDDYPAYLQGRLHLDEDISLVKKILLKQGLIQESPTKYQLSLTSKGFNAAELGYQAYLDKISNAERLDNEAKTATVQTAKWTKIYSISAIIISVIALITSIWALLAQ